MILDKDELEHLGEVIGRNELSTAGEIRLIIVKRSVSVAMVRPLLWLALTCVTLLGFWYQRTHFVNVSPWTLPLACVATAALATVLSQVTPLARLIVGPAERAFVTRTRAELEFHREGLTKTADGTGILLFLSLFERTAVVLADRGINERCPPHTWDGVVDLILEGARQKSWAPKLEEAVNLCGSLLSQHFPVQPGDVNELPNAVIVKD